MTALIDQATTLRSLVQERRRASVIAITSGKGGVGKSNVAVNLAIKLSAAGKRVVLLDADLGLANADVLCNIDLPCNLSHVIARKKELADVNDVLERTRIAESTQRVALLDELNSLQQENGNLRNQLRRNGGK